ncbi:MAG: heme-copper oxidase subunit III [Actinobacteria bacterium]|nr:heme-copper oxidase subunit III [Actinomycetota bacterium]
MASVAHAPEHDHHGPPAANVSSRVDARLLGIYIFIASEVMLFGSFFTAFFFARIIVPNETWPPEPFELPVYLALINTIILVTSSFTMHWALQSIKRNYRAGLIAGLTLTFLLGLTFLLIQAREYTRIGFAPKDLAFGSSFFGLTGLHGMHVFVGLNLLLYALIRSIRGHFGPKAHDHLGVEIPGIYWHFVDVMWIIVYVTVYVI